MVMPLQAQKGFTLLELLLSIAVLLILTVAAREFYAGYIRSNELDTAARMLAADLAMARSKAMAGGSDYHWGVHLVNQAGAPDYYEIFASPAGYASASTTTKQTVYLPKVVDFSDPAVGNSKDVVFNRLTGASSATSTTISTLDSARTVFVSDNGLIH